MKTKNDYIDALALELKEWSEQLDLLSAKVEKAVADEKLKHTEDLKALHAKRQVAAKKIQELQEASSEAWDSVKDTADTLWDELRTGLSTAKSKFD